MGSRSRKVTLERERRVKRERKRARRLANAQEQPLRRSLGEWLPRFRPLCRHELYFPAALARPNDPAKVVT